MYDGWCDCPNFGPEDRKGKVGDILQKLNKYFENKPNRVLLSKMSGFVKIINQAMCRFQKMLSQEAVSIVDKKYAFFHAKILGPKIRQNIKKIFYFFFAQTNVELVQSVSATLPITDPLRRHFSVR